MKITDVWCDFSALYNRVRRSRRRDCWRGCGGERASTAWLDGLKRRHRRRRRRRRGYCQLLLPQCSMSLRLKHIVGRYGCSTSFTAWRITPDANACNRVDAAPSEVPSEAASAARRAWPPIGSDDVLWTSWSSRCETPAASLAHTPSESSLPPADTQQDVLEIDAAQRLLRLHPPRDIFPKISRDDPRLFPTAHSHDPTSASSLPESWKRPMPVDSEAPVNAPHTEALQALQRRQQDQGG